MKSKINLPGFTGNISMYAADSNKVVTANPAKVKLTKYGTMNQVIPSDVPIICGPRTCRQEVCGSPEPGSPPPMCTVCSRRCHVAGGGGPVIIIRGYAYA